ncbi:hypothetical protein P8452_61738 [Trifolium repens]|nr:hypothetical protein P8452_61738 [Trifolium repens]
MSLTPSSFVPSLSSINFSSLDLDDYKYFLEKLLTYKHSLVSPSQNLQRKNSTGASWSVTTVPEMIFAANMAFPVNFYMHPFHVSCWR